MEEPLLTELIAPIPGDDPVGHDVRIGAASGLYLAVKDERSAARIAEREALASGDPEAEPLLAGLRAWSEVASGGAELIAHQAKDLQVAAWLVEAWVRTDGLPGLADGFTLLAELVQHYWDEGLHPVEDEDEAEGRLAPLFGLFGREEAGALIQPIKLLPLTDAAGESVALWSVEAARAQSVRHDDADMREELVSRRAQRIAALESGIAHASHGFVRASLDAVERAMAELDRLMAVLDLKTHKGRFGSQVTAPLLAIADLLRQHGPAAEAVASASVGLDDAAGNAVAGEKDSSPAMQPSPQRTALDRTAALASLLEIAGFFERTEPQSLIGGGIRDLVRRAALPLEDLLAELLPDRDQRAMFMLRAGIRLEPESGGGSGYTTF